MVFGQRYDSGQTENDLMIEWQEKGVYHFEPESSRPVFSIDTPPPTVSGHLHLGHVYSYSHADFLARFWRMNGYNVYYPMGYDDNGLPTERLVEKWEKVTAGEIGRPAFIERCLTVSVEAEKAYRQLWQRLGLSVDWRYSYRTIDELARRTAQWSFVDLYHKGLAYRQQAPTIWCPTCQTAIAQAEVDDLERESSFYTLDFQLEGGGSLPIATTRPELLPACVAIFIHPDDPRRPELTNQRAIVPLFGRSVPVLVDPAADPAKGTGAVMCCTFGDMTDVAWWHTHQLPLLEIIGRDGRLLAPAGSFAGLSVATGRQQIVQTLVGQGLLLAQQPIRQTVRCHERCDTPVEFIVTNQWFIRVLPFKADLVAMGEQIDWYPDHFRLRYRQWVENLAWDWCISRQRYFGVPFPVWYCNQCGQSVVADEWQLPIDPENQPPGRNCPHCGHDQFTPEQDVMDTWATSSLTPQIVGQLFATPTLYEQLSPFTLRPQAHEIIRTWAFYTIVKSYHHWGRLPWANVAISGWGLAPAGTGKISKSKGNSQQAPMAMIEQYSADAVRYWAASTGLGKDAIIDQQKMEAGARLANKLWNIARFAERFLADYQPPSDLPPSLTVADRWLLSAGQKLISRLTDLFRHYDYATAKSEFEQFFWKGLADNYLEMAKRRLYEGGPAGDGSRFTLYHTLQTSLHLLAPIMPYVTEAIYRGLFAPAGTIHRNPWPQANPTWLDETSEQLGNLLIEIASAVRRYKSEANLSLGSEIAHLHLTTADEKLLALLPAASDDLSSITRATQLTTGNRSQPDLESIWENGTIEVALKR